MGNLVHQSCLDSIVMLPPHKNKSSNCEHDNNRTKLEKNHGKQRKKNFFVRERIGTLQKDRSRQPEVRNPQSPVGRIVLSNLFLNYKFSIAYSPDIIVNDLIEIKTNRIWIQIYLYGFIIKSY